MSQRQCVLCRSTCEYNKVFIVLRTITRRKMYDEEKFLFAARSAILFFSNWRLISIGAICTSANIFRSANWLCAIREKRFTGLVRFCISDEGLNAAARAIREFISRKLSASNRQSSRVIPVPSYELQWGDSRSATPDECERYTERVREREKMARVRKDGGGWE